MATENESEQPSIVTSRLHLRALVNTDAKTVQRLAGDAHIAAMTDNVPHPYEDGMAEAWIEATSTMWLHGKSATFAVCLQETDELIGCCGLSIVQRHRRASLGYWVGRDFWGHGYCTEAAGAVVGFGFKELGLHRIFAMHLCKNPASGAVMRRIGMKHEATLSDYVLKNNVFEDMELYTIFPDKNPVN